MERQQIMVLGSAECGRLPVRRTIRRVRFPLGPPKLLEFMKKLIKWSTNWADEMDLEGWVITDHKDVEKWKEHLQTLKECTLSFGSNEWNDYYSGQEILQECSIMDIPDADAEVIQKWFGSSGGLTEFWSGVWYQ